MTREEYLKFHQEFTSKMYEICKKKNQDYSGSGEYAFHNFKRIELIGVASTEVGFLTRMFDKFSRIVSFLENGELAVKDESVEDTLIDLANYSALMAGYLKSKKEGKK